MRNSKPPQPGVAEDPAPFRSTEDDWAIAYARLEEHERTGTSTSVEEFVAELRRQVASKRAAKA